MSQQNSVERYFNEIKEDILTREEEVELAKRIEKDDEQAKKELAKHNLKLVINIAKKYRNNGLPFPDLIQEGNIGLIKAVDKFNWRKGYKFSTYAVWWIRQTIFRALNNQSRTIRIPTCVQKLGREINKLEREIKEKRGETLTDKELAKELDVPKKKIQKAKKATQFTISLDKPLEEGTDGTLKKVVSSKERPPEQIIHQDIVSENLEKVMEEVLTDRERRIVKLRYGLEDYHPRTLEEVANVFDISRERVRQLQKRAIDKLRTSKIKKQLKGLPA